MIKKGAMAPITIRQFQLDHWIEEGVKFRKSRSEYRALIGELVEANKLFLKFFDEMPNGQFGKIVCDIGILNDAFLKSRKVIAKARARMGK